MVEIQKNGRSKIGFFQLSKVEQEKLFGCEKAPKRELWSETSSTDTALKTPSHGSHQRQGPSPKCDGLSRANTMLWRRNDNRRGKQHTSRHRIFREKEVRFGRGERQFRDTHPLQCLELDGLADTRLGIEDVLPHGPEGWDQD